MNRKTPCPVRHTVFLVRKADFLLGILLSGEGVLVFSEGKLVWRLQKVERIQVHRLRSILQPEFSFGNPGGEVQKANGELSFLAIRSLTDADRSLLYQITGPTEQSGGGTPTPPPPAPPTP